MKIQNIVNIILAVLCLAFAVLCLAFAVLWLRAERADRNDLNTIPDTVNVCDTANIIAPTPTSEMVVGHTTAVLERADKRAEAKMEKIEMNIKGELKSELTGELNIEACNPACNLTCNLTCNLEQDSARLINEVSKVAPDTNAATKTAIEDSVAVIVPISEKVYEDSLYRAVVRGYQAELVSLDIYRQHTYYPVVVEKEHDPPNIVVTIGPSVGFGNKGFYYGLSLNVGVPISFKRKR